MTMIILCLRFGMRGEEGLPVQKTKKTNLNSKKVSSAKRWKMQVLRVAIIWRQLISLILHRSN